MKEVINRLAVRKTEHIGSSRELIASSNCQIFQGKDLVLSYKPIEDVDLAGHKKFQMALGDRAPHSPVE